MTMGGNNLAQWLLGQVGGGGGGGIKFQSSVLVDSAALTGKSMTPFSQSVTIPADTLAVGDRIEVAASFDCTGASGSPSFAFGAHFGGSNIAPDMSLQGITTSTNPVYRATGIVRSIGATAVIAWSQETTFANGARGEGGTANAVSTSDQAFQVTGRFSTSASGNTIVQKGLVVTVTAAAP